MLRFWVRNAAGTLEDISDRVVLRFGANPQNMAMNAEERSVGGWELDVDDPDGDLVLSSYRDFIVEETEADFLRVWAGYTLDRTSQRVDRRTGPERVVTLQLVDVNSYLERRVIREGDAGNRPAETDVQRMGWLFDQGYLGAVDDFIFGDDPEDLDPNDWTGRMVSEVIEDAMGQSGKNAFMFPWRDGGGVYRAAFFYGSSAADLDRLTSDVCITNVLSDLTLADGGDAATFWAASLDSTFQELSSRVFSGVFANFDGGARYTEKAATVTAFGRRDTVISWPDVKTDAKANRRNQRYLDTIDTEEHVITTAIEVPPERVNDVLAGYRVRVRFSHFPPYSDDGYTWVRVLNRAVTWLSPERYRIRLELSATASDAGNGGVTYPDLCQVPLAEDVGSGLMMPMRVTLNGALGPGTGDSYVDFGEHCTLYRGATYAVHTFGTSFIGPQPLTPMRSVLNNSSLYSADLGSTDCGFVPAHTLYCPPLTERLDLLVGPGSPAGEAFDVVARLGFLPWSGHNPQGSSWYVVLSYVSGPDPRFVGVSCPVPDTIP